MENEIKNILDCELKKVELSINNYNYVFVVSDDIEIRNYFINNISKLDNVSVIDDSKTQSDEVLANTLKDCNVLLLNAEIKAEQLRKLNNKNDLYNSLYYRLVFKREFLAKYKKSIIIVCDEHAIKPILCENQSLVSVSNILFVDDNIKEEKNKIKIKK